MSTALYFPHDELGGGQINLDMAADYLELTAFFAPERVAMAKDLINATEIGADEEYDDVDDELARREEIISGAINRIEGRFRALGEAYPFTLDERGEVLTYSYNASLGQGAYILSLILSHLSRVSPILNGSALHPSQDEIRLLRQYFQYFATAALAAEVNGVAWSFGYPRPDRTNFKDKLTAVWRVFRDGFLLPEGARGAPTHPKDDQVDVFAARMHSDGLPGFLLAAGQVATGANWRDKSIRSHVSRVFYQRWFGEQPVTEMICYHLIPFARRDDDFFDDVRVLGNVLHRTRLPLRVQQAAGVAAAGFDIEAYDLLPNALTWLQEYQSRAQTPPAAS